MLEYDEYIKVFIALIAILNPIAVIPFFISMTSDVEDNEKRSLINLVVFSVAIILMVSLIAGESILNFFGISISSFRVAGGILIFSMSLSMLHAKTSATIQTSEEANEAAQRDSIAIVPLATPLLAGPGAISTIILYAHRGTDLTHYLFIGLDILAVVAVLFMTLKLIPIIQPHLSKTGINIFTRIMGLLLTAIAVEFIANGLKGLFPTLI